MGTAELATAALLGLLAGALLAAAAVGARWLAGVLLAAVVGFWRGWRDGRREVRR